MPTATTMKEVFVRSEGSTVVAELREAAIPPPKAHEVLVKVMSTASNPKDWKYVVQFREQLGVKEMNTGDDIAGYVEAVGDDVTEFKKGDRVAAFHIMGDPHGSYAEYAIAPEDTTFHIPKKTSFDEASTIPLAAMTAALALYQTLRLPPPWRPASASTRTPLIIYGGSTAVGAFALKLAKLSNIHPIITVCGAGKPYVESLNAADHIIDYRSTSDVANAIRAVLGNEECFHALDAVSYDATIATLGKVISRNGQITTVLPASSPPEGITYTWTHVGSVHQKTYFPGSTPGANKDFGYIFFRYFSKLLKEGRFSGHPQKLLGGLESVETGLRMLMEGKISAEKCVYRVKQE